MACTQGTSHALLYAPTSYGYVHMQHMGFVAGMGVFHPCYLPDDVRHRTAHCRGPHGSSASASTPSAPAPTCAITHDARCRCA